MPRATSNWLAALSSSAHCTAGKRLQPLTADEQSKLAAGEPIVRVSEAPSGPADGAIYAAIDIPAAPGRGCGRFCSIALPRQPSCRA